MNSGPRAHRLNVLPAEKVGNAQAVVGGLVDRVEGGVCRVLRRIAVARGVLLLGTDARLGLTVGWSDYQSTACQSARSQRDLLR